MDNQNIVPRTLRAKIVHFIWRNFPKFFMGCLIVFIFIFGSIISNKKKMMETNKDSINQKHPSINAAVLLLKPAEIKDCINLPGSIEPWTRLELKTKVDGAIEKIFVKQGDNVKKGDILFSIEKNDYLIALQRAKAANKLALAEYKRNKKLYEIGVLPLLELDIKTTKMNTAKADLEDCKLQYSRCDIISPIKGVIQKIDAEIGLLLSKGDMVCELLNIDKVKAVINIPESDITAVKQLKTVDLTIQALGNYKVKGKKYFLSKSPDTAAHVYKLELALDNKDKKIFPGMFVRANIIKKAIKNTIIIPFYSVISRNNEHFVFIEKNGTAIKKNVKLGIMEKWMVQVTSGLKHGDRILIEGHRDVEDNQKINIVKKITEITKSGEF